MTDINQQKAPVQTTASANQGLVWAVAIVVLLMAGVLAADRLFQPERFRFDQLVISGSAERIDRADLSQQLQETLGGNYFSVDMQKIEAVAANFPWIEHVSVRRKWPDTLLVMINEYQVVAHWADKGWLTVTGKVVSLPMEPSLALPHLSGPVPQAAQVWDAYQRWNKAFSRVGLQLHSLELSKGHLWKGRIRLTTAMLENNHQQGDQQTGVESQQLPASQRQQSFNIVLFQANAEQQISTLISSLTSELKDRLSKIEKVDLRYHHGFAVQWKAQQSSLNSPKALQTEFRQNETRQTHIRQSKTRHRVAKIIS